MSPPSIVNEVSEMPDYSEISGVSDTSKEFVNFLKRYDRTVNVMEKRGDFTPGVILEGRKSNYREEFALFCPKLLDEEFAQVYADDLIREDDFKKSLKEVLEYSEKNNLSLVFSNIGILSGRVSNYRDFYDLISKYMQKGIRFYLTCEDVTEFGKEYNILRLGFRKYNVDDISEREHREIIEDYILEEELADDVSFTHIMEASRGRSRRDIEVFIQRVLFSSERDSDGNILITKDSLSDAVSQLSSLVSGEFKLRNPQIGYEEVGGLDKEIEKIKEIIEWPLEEADIMKEFDAETPKGILLYGPPGTGKTLLAKATAGESSSNMMEVSCSSIMQKFLGQSEEKIRDIFRTARKYKPCIIFFDEFDAISFKRGENSHVKSTATADRVISQLLSELDGLDSEERVKVIASTNRKEAIDNAVLRSGRIGEQIEIPKPKTVEARKDILEIHLTGKPTQEMNLTDISEKMEGMTGSDIEKVTNRAALNKIRSIKQGGGQRNITQTDIEEAINEIRDTDEDYISRTFG